MREAPTPHLSPLPSFSPIPFRFTPRDEEDLRTSSVDLRLGRDPSPQSTTKFLSKKKSPSSSFLPTPRDPSLSPLRQHSHEKKVSFASLGDDYLLLIDECSSHSSEDSGIEEGSNSASPASSINGKLVKIHHRRGSSLVDNRSILRGSPSPTLLSTTSCSSSFIRRRISSKRRTSSSSFTSLRSEEEEEEGKEEEKQLRSWRSMSMSPVRLAKHERKQQLSQVTNEDRKRVIEKAFGSRIEDPLVVSYDSLSRVSLHHMKQKEKLKNQTRKMHSTYIESIQSIGGFFEEEHETNHETGKLNKPEIQEYQLRYTRSASLDSRQTLQMSLEKEISDERRSRNLYEKRSGEKTPSILLADTAESSEDFDQEMTKLQDLRSKLQPSSTYSKLVDVASSLAVAKGIRHPLGEFHSFPITSKRVQSKRNSTQQVRSPSLSPAQKTEPTKTNHLKYRSISSLSSLSRMDSASSSTVLSNVNSFFGNEISSNSSSPSSLSKRERIFGNEILCEENERRRGNSLSPPAQSSTSIEQRKTKRMIQASAPVAIQTVLELDPLRLLPTLESETLKHASSFRMSTDRACHEKVLRIPSNANVVVESSLQKDHDKAVRTVSPSPLSPSNSAANFSPLSLDDEEKLLQEYSQLRSKEKLNYLKRESRVRRIFSSRTDSFLAERKIAKNRKQLEYTRNFIRENKIQTQSIACSGTSDEYESLGTRRNHASIDTRDSGGSRRGSRSQEINSGEDSAVIIRGRRIWIQRIWLCMIAFLNRFHVMTSRFNKK